MEKKGEANFDNRFYSLNVYKIFFFPEKKKDADHNIKSNTMACF